MKDKKKVIVLNKDTIDKLIEVSKIMLKNAINKNIDCRHYERIFNNYVKIKDIYDSENEIKKYLYWKLYIYYNENNRKEFEIIVDKLLKDVIGKKLRMFLNNKMNFIRVQMA